MDRKLDEAATGPRWLEDERVAQVVADALHYGERQLALYQLRAWVLMVNHVHILIYPEARLSRITRAIKNHSARQANAILGLAVWQDESYDHWVRGPEELAKIVRYIEKNPVTAGLVSRAEDWRWSSAFCLEGQASHHERNTPQSMKMGKMERKPIGDEVVPQWYCESEGQSDPGVKGTPKCTAPPQREHAR